MSAEAARQREFSFTDADFDALRRLVREITGIALTDAKRELVYGRLSRRLRQLGLDSFSDYCALLHSPGGRDEVGPFANAITTNLTSFFRENHHFDYLRDHFLKVRAAAAGASRRIRIWCAASSTGEEPFSIAMTVAQAIPDWQHWDIRILATDLDTDVLAHCEAGVYREERLAGLPRQQVERHFIREQGARGPAFRIRPELARMVSFRQLNLMHPLPMRGPLDVIFCRNVIIYFDKDTQRDLFARMAPLQRSGGLLFLGHSESLFKVSDAWELLGRTVYRRSGP